VYTSTTASPLELIILRVNSISFCRCLVAFVMCTLYSSQWKCQNVTVAVFCVTLYMLACTSLERRISLTTICMCVCMYACVSVRTCAVAKQTFSVAVAVASCARSLSLVQSSSLISHDAAYVARRYFHRDLSMPQRPFYVTANFAYFLIHIFHRLFIDIYECGLVKRSIASVCRSCYDSTF